MDAWEHEAALSRQIRRWAGASMAGGALLAVVGALRRDTRLRDFGVQNAGWGVINAGIAVGADRVRRRRLARLADPRAPDVLAREHRVLRRLLVVNAGLDVGYVACGLAWYRSRDRSRGHGAAVLVQGAFLLAFDSVHARRLGRPPAPS